MIPIIRNENGEIDIRQIAGGILIIAVLIILYIKLKPITCSNISDPKWLPSWC